uniref:Uncharacterized protein n=1 Tax=viral metagenome TaxID=1070528 RepID=A0A6H1ZWP6_9ZZZZ
MKPIKLGPTLVATFDGECVELSQGGSSIILYTDDLRTLVAYIPKVLAIMPPIREMDKYSYKEL